ncbi:cyclic nucleotide-binding domain-containing protein [Propionivibrio sp.]|uniref:cyclic nucleotide-binding domain-containing protein n=1 Tax=Propionivibrio sp. TaxID=2212460 RepID=UPI003BF453B8
MRFAEKFIQDFASGEAVFEEGVAGEEMFVVLSGTIEIVKQGASGPLPVATLTKGEMFGEMALVDSGVRSAGAIAGASGASVVRIDEARFVYLVSQQPAFGLSVMRIMARRLAAKPLTEAAV